LDPPPFDARTGGSYTARACALKANAMDAKEFIRKTIAENPVVLFMKGTAQFPQCGFSGRAIQILKSCGVKNLVTVNVLEDEEVRQGIKEYANWPTIPQLYVKGQFIGGSDIMMEMYQSGELQDLLKQAEVV
jgi:monothiol glutaredoxin